VIFVTGETKTKYTCKTRRNYTHLNLKSCPTLKRRNTINMSNFLKFIEFTLLYDDKAYAKLVVGHLIFNLS